MVYTIEEITLWLQPRVTGVVALGNMFRIALRHHHPRIMLLVQVTVGVIIRTLRITTVVVILRVMAILRDMAAVVVRVLSFPLIGNHNSPEQLQAAILRRTEQVVTIRAL